MRRDLPFPVDPVRIHFLDQEPLEPVGERAKLGPVEPNFRKGMDEVEPEVAEEDLLQEGRRRPLRFTSLFRNPAGLGFGKRARLGIGSHHQNFTVKWQVET